MYFYGMGTETEKRSLTEIESKLMLKHIGLLTDAEKQILQYLADDKRPGEIAAKMVYSKRTVEGKVDALRDKFGCETVAGLVAFFFRINLVK